VKKRSGLVKAKLKKNFAANIFKKQVLKNRRFFKHIVKIFDFYEFKKEIENSQIGDLKQCQ